ncbi:hypothetical protein MNBD_ALPHA04-2316, partial [hydrothermal vent metagenome]
MLASCSNHSYGVMPRFYIHIIQCLVAPLVLFLAPYAGNASGLIVNELSNGPSGSKEFYEL